MSTDSTELTFVRCPSCRSLVPAVSTRCRMCGAALDPAAKVDEASEAERRSSRVRQKTMSAAHSELSSTAGQIREEIGASVSEEDPFDLDDDEVGQATEPAGIEDDPLGDYIQEVEEQPKGGEKSPAPFRAATNNPKSNGPTPPVSAAEPRTALSPAKPESRTEQVREDRAQREAASQRDEQKNRPAADGSARDMASRHPAGKPPGLSFSRSREEQQQRRDDSRATQSGNTDSMRNNRQNEGQRHEGTRPQRDNRRPDQFDDSRTRQTNENAPAEQKNREPVPQRSAGQEGVELAGESSGRIFGWLVSFDRPEGNAIELREGKFFITGSQLKKHDLVIAGKNLSTPHVMVSIGREQGFRVQDLMSESGTFVRRRTSQSYEKEEGVVTIDHGDWVKFGNAEFVVAIVAYGK